MFASASNNTLAATLNGITYQVEAAADPAAWDHPLTDVAAVVSGLPAAPAGY